MVGLSFHDGDPTSVEMDGDEEKIRAERANARIDSQSRELADGETGEPRKAQRIGPLNADAFGVCFNPGARPVAEKVGDRRQGERGPGAANGDALDPGPCGKVGKGQSEED